MKAARQRRGDVLWGESFAVHAVQVLRPNSQADPQSGVLGLVPNWVGLRPSPGRVVEDKESKKNLGLRIFLPFRQFFWFWFFRHQSGSARTRIWHETRRKRINWKIVDCRQQEHRQRGGAYSALLIQRDFVRTTGTTQVRCQGWAEVLASYAEMVQAASGGTRGSTGANCCGCGDLKPKKQQGPPLVVCNSPRFPRPMIDVNF